MARTQAVTILFCDLVASTERRARLGDDAFDAFSAELFVVLRDAIARAGGREVSSAGDGMMVVFPDSVADAVSCATEMHAEVPKLDADDPPRLRIGISCGEVAQDGDQFSGMPIVEAARLEAKAAPGQTLANAVVRALVGNRRALRFRDVGALTLKGIPEPLATVEVIVDDVADLPVPATAPERHRSKRRRPIGAAIVGVVVVVIAGVVVVTNRGGSNAGGPVQATPGTNVHNYRVAYSATTCPADVSRNIPGLTCGTLTVPEDRSKPNGRVVKLGVFRAPARGKASSDPVLDFGADDLASSPARDHSEEIQLAQRGWSGEPGSVPVLACPEFVKVGPEMLVKPSGDPGVQEREAAALRECHDRLTKAGIDLSTYNYLAIGDDMVDLIRALHLDHVNLISGYVATVGALEVTRELPGVVRTLTLQEPVPAGRSRYSDPTRLLSNAFNAYAALCRADAACKTSFPDLGADLKHDYDVYRTKPRVARGDDGNGHQYDVLIDGPRVALAVFSGLDDRGDYGVLAAGVAARDRSGAIDQLTAGRILQYYGPNLDPTFDWGAQLSNTCSYDRYTIDAGHTLSSGAVPELSGIDDGFLTWACDAWKVKRIGSAAFDDPRATVPTLVVSGNLAPNSDQQWPDQFQQTLPNAVVAQFPTLNSFVLGANDPRCLSDLRRAFLADPEGHLDVAGCVRQSPKIVFVGSLG